MKLVIDLSISTDVEAGYQHLGLLLTKEPASIVEPAPAQAGLSAIDAAPPQQDVATGLEGLTTVEPAAAADPMAAMLNGGVEGPTQQDVEEAFRTMATACGRDLAITNGNNALQALGVAELNAIPVERRGDFIKAMNLFAAQAQA